MKKNSFEKFMLVFATVEPIATIPQIIAVWNSSGSQGVSLITWAFYTMTSIIWFAYGIIQKDKPLILSGALWVTSQGLVVLGILIN
jgi:uncharacterized protein with PQ loop repeat